ncbi:hypothetical protein [Fredinandcohnia quinoae]|uniref:Phospholipid phosphatase n=1 Tax=Fredinandcohnia quinoae TaxID=2918902 RepID=A0AAW5DV63_9BACI|nr:hypothetical protein [Fredinandcohnia sp. SECRCQ15]MCH1624525.1 hypothetical protein [Fredinandcohnia sp. SECRCQ15]
MVVVLYFLLGFGYLGLLTWGILLARKDRFFNLTNVLLLVIIGLVYDNFIIALGRFIGEGNKLENLSYARFWLHALFTPTLILFAWSFCNGIGLLWAKKVFWRILSCLLTIGVILYELLTSVKGLELEPKWKNGVLTYERAVGSDSLIMVTVVTLVIAIVGFILIKNFHFPWLFIGTMIMILGGLLTIWLKSFPIMNVLEFLFMISLLMTKQFQVKYIKENTR